MLNISQYGVKIITNNQETITNTTNQETNPQIGIPKLVLKLIIGCFI